MTTKVYVVLAWMEYYPDSDNTQGAFFNKEAATEKVLSMARDGHSFDRVDIRTIEVQ
jgi:hypothetical protein